MQSHVDNPAIDLDSLETSSPRFHWHLEGSLDGNSGLNLVRLTRCPFVVGRSVDSDCVLASRNVSKKHAEILVAGDAVFVRDLGSTNGTFVNGVRVTAATPVGEGDLIQFADVELRLGSQEAAPHFVTNINESLADGWMISRFRTLLAEEQLTMHFQPIVLARGMSSMGVEALVRCEYSDLKQPRELFDAAARLGLEPRVSRLCRKKAVEAMLQSPCNDDLFVNTHPSEKLGSELIDEMQTLRQLSGPRRIVLELHEAAVPDTQSIIDFRNALKDIGVELAYDDFGAGQSRLVELAKVPPDYLKFDQSLVNGLGCASSTHLTLLETLVRMANDAGIAAVAEGLEDPESVRICRQLGFTHLQGFAIRRPMPVDRLTDTWMTDLSR